MKTKGNAEFVQAYKQLFGRDPEYHSASNFAAMEVLEAAVKKAGSLDQDKIAAAIATLELDTVYGRFKLDERGVQLGYVSALLQWQRGKQVVVWPETAALGKAMLPTPPWSERK
jgi:branched-chain amino acid transport system substrate-binding protein